MKKANLLHIVEIAAHLAIVLTIITAVAKGL